jgi:isopropylmalate/homocitrate/citramalate synthase
MVLALLLGVKTGIHLEQIYSTCQLVAELTKHPIARNKPIVGENMFLSGSGQVIWRHGKLSQTDRPFADMAFDPQVIGKGGEMLEVVLGVGCGKTIVKDKLQKMGIRASEEQAEEIVQRVKEEAYILKWSLTDAQFEDIVKNVLEK